MADLDELVQVATRRNALVRQITTCTSCPLHLVSGVSPVPFRGPAPSSLMVVGDSPGRVENRTHKPFVGPAGVLLARTFTDAGLDLSRVFAANVVCCYPAGPPELDSQKACRPNLRAQIALADPQWVLLLGIVAASSTGAKLKIAKHHGRPFLMPAGPYQGRWCLLTYHPSAILRDEHYSGGGDVSAKETAFRNDIGFLARLLKGRETVEGSVLRIGRGGNVYT